MEEWRRRGVELCDLSWGKGHIQDIPRISSRSGAYVNRLYHSEVTVCGWGFDALQREKSDYQAEGNHCQLRTCRRVQYDPSLLQKCRIPMCIWN